MSAQDIKVQGGEPLATYDLPQITELLIKQNGLHEGLYDVAIEFQMGVGPIAFNNVGNLPSAIVGVSRIVLIKPNTPGATTVDAAIVNPAPKINKL